MTEKFDNTKPNVILIADKVDEFTMTKTYGIFKVARELRLAGYEVAVLHHTHIFSLDELLHIVKNLISEHTLFVGISNLFYSATNTNSQGKTRSIKGSMLPHDEESNDKFKKYIKSIAPSCKFVAGGPNAIDSSVNKDFDYVVVGYADNSVINLANHLSFGEALEKSYRSLHGFTVIDDSKAVDFDFVNSKMEYKSYDCILPGETLLLEVSRGCIFKCAFCAFPLNGKKKNDYIKDRELLKQELIENYNNYQVTRYMMLDDTFNDSVEKVKMIYEISKELPFKLEYWAYIRLDLLAAHPETIDMLVESGLRSAFFGIESFNPETCKAVNKGGSRQKQWDTLRYIKDKWGNKINCHGSFIIGLPYEPVESINKTFEELMADDCLLDSWMISEFIIHADKLSTYTSLIEQNPEKYGYKINPVPIPGSNNTLNWENEHLDYKTAVRMAFDFTSKSLTKKKTVLDGREAFEIAAMGTGLDWAINKDIKDFNWAALRMFKQKRAKQYKKMFYEKFNISQLVDK